MDRRGIFGNKGKFILMWPDVYTDIVNSEGYKLCFSDLFQAESDIIKKQLQQQQNKNRHWHKIIWRPSSFHINNLLNYTHAR